MDRLLSKLYNIFVDIPVKRKYHTGILILRREFL